MKKNISIDKETLILVFSDIEGSTNLSLSLKGKYSDLLDMHNQIIRSELEKRGGMEIENEGDSFFIVFWSIKEALQFAVKIQKTLTVQLWPGKKMLKVRMGLHLGEVFKKNGKYTGEEIHRCSRICDAGQGGQILLSQEIASLSKDQIPAGTKLIDKGYYALKSFHAPIQLFQLHIPGIGKQFDSPRSIAAVPILAIMPFKNLSVKKEDKGLCEGIAEDLIININKIQGLRVLSKSTSFALKKSATTPAGNLLKATVILEGSVKKSKNRIRISALLLEVVSGLNLWSEQYEGNMTELLSFQDDILFKVVQIMHVGDGEGKIRGIQAIHSRNVEAYEYYLRGRQFFYQFSEKDIKFAIRMYRKAIEFDSGYALAYGGLSECYSYLYMYSKTDKRNLLQSNQSSKVAIKLDPLLAEAWTSRGVSLSLKNKYKKAEIAFEKAIKLDPMLFETFYQFARMSFAQGNYKKAASLYNTASEIRPDDYQSPLLSAQSYEAMDQTDKAFDLRKKGLEIAEENLKFNPGDIRALSLAANGLAAMGEDEKAINFLQRALILEPDDAMLLYNAGCIYAMTGKEAEALNYLEKSVETGLTQKDWYIHDSNLDSIRERKRFIEMLEKME